MAECHVCGQSLGIFAKRCRMCGRFTCKERGHLGPDGICVICKEKIKGR